MLRTLRAYPVLLRASFARALVYRAEMIIFIFTGTMPLVMMFIWLTLAGDGEINGFTSNDFVAYYLGALLVRRITGTWIVWDFDALIRKGELSPYLLRPLDAMHYFLARTLAGRAFQIPILLVPITIAAWFLPGQQFDTSPLNLLAFIIACAIGIAFEFLAQHIISALAFWITQVTAIAEAWFFVKSFLGGYLAPLALLPGGMRAVLEWMPFQISLAFPIEILIGRASPERMAQGFGVGIAWLVLLAVVDRAVWRAGVRAYSAVGA